MPLAWSEYVRVVKRGLKSWDQIALRGLHLTRKLNLENGCEP